MPPAGANHADWTESMGPAEAAGVSSASFRHLSCSCGRFRDLTCMCILYTWMGSAGTSNGGGCPRSEWLGSMGFHDQVRCECLQKPHEQHW